MEPREWSLAGLGGLAAQEHVWTCEGSVNPFT